LSDDGNIWKITTYTLTLILTVCWSFATRKHQDFAITFGLFYCWLAVI